VDEPNAPPTTPARGALAGLAGALAALVVIEFVSLVDADGVSVTTAVENRFVDRFAGSLKDFAVQQFGRNDKVALQVGTVAVILMIGAAVGALAGDRWRLVAGVFAAFAVVGIVAAIDDPLASRPVAAVASLLGAAAGAGATIGLERRWRAAIGSSGVEPSSPAARRAVLVSGGATVVGLVASGGIARAARHSLRRAAETATRVLPAPKRRVRVPRQPFDVDGVSPYITSRRDFYRIDTAPADPPIVDPESWKLRVTGKVDRELTFTYDDLFARTDLIEVPITMQCVSNEVGGDLIGTARWTGVPLATILHEAGVHRDADQVIGESVDGFTAGFPTQVALDGRDALLAIGMDGLSLPIAHGFPARLVVPGLYGYVSATKWLKEIRLTTFDAEEGFWIPRGWSRLGPIKTQSRIDVPRDGGSVRAGRVPIGGVAWAPHRGIERVEVRVDDGPWQRAELGRVASADTWVQWRLDWAATPGNHRLSVRATSADGNVQTAREAPPAPDGATGHHTIEVAVS
jgi:DMSO/TMAO reductase YedYZ molybdopterin-dependent catalytic subunit